MKPAAMFWMVAAFGAICAVLLASDATRRMRLAEADARALASLEGDMRRLAAYSAAEALVDSQAGKGEGAESVPLPVSIPLPDFINPIPVKSETLDVTEFGLGWKRLPSKTALEALAAICNLNAPWRATGFRLEALADGESCSLDANVTRVLPASGQ